MKSREFLQALRLQVRCYQLLHDAVRRQYPPSFARMVLMDPFSRAAGEEFGAPLVEWFPFDSPVRGVCVADGTLVFQLDQRLDVTVLFLAGVHARDAGDLPVGWQTRAERMLLLDGNATPDAALDDAAAKLPAAAGAH